jgi:hypothetical protein
MVYILLHERGAATGKLWGWKINTSTDAGEVDLDNVTLNGTQTTKLELRWDFFNTKLYIAFGNSGDYLAYYIQIVLDGTINTPSSVSFVSNDKLIMGFDIDAQGNKFMAALATSSGYNALKKVSPLTSLNAGAFTTIATWMGVVCDYNDKPILGYIIGTVIHIYRATNDLASWEITDANTDLGAGHDPEIAFFTIDAVNNIYCVFTDSSDHEAYYIKYNVTTSSWGSAIKISSDNDGKLVCPELKVPIDKTQMLITYQAVV